MSEEEQLAMAEKIEQLRALLNVIDPDWSQRGYAYKKLCNEKHPAFAKLIAERVEIERVDREEGHLAY